MGKKSINRKEATEYINKSRSEGQSDQEIYNELTQRYFDKKSVAQIITGTVKEENKQKYKMLNNILIALLALSLLLKILAIINIGFETKEYIVLILLIIIPFFSVYFIYEISKYYAPVYRFCGGLTIAGFLKTVGNSPSETDLILNIIFTAGIVGLSFYLDQKMFPDYSPNNLKKGSNGEYIL